MKLAALVLLVPATACARPQPDRTATYAVPVDGYPSDGPADAKVTMVVAHDYADPFSNKNRATLDELRKKYGNELRIVFRNMVVHPRNAMASALASCAAHKQKKFDAMEDKLWEAFQQRQLDPSDVDDGNGPQKCWEVPEGCPIVVGIAKELGLRVDRFKADMKSCAQHVADDMRELQQFAVGATPSFFINGRFMSGSMPTPEFEKLIDEEMAKATDAIRKGTLKSRYYRTFVIGKGEKKVDMMQPPPAGAPAMGGGARPVRREPDRALTYAVPVDGYPSQGPADAPVTLVIAHDYADPYSEKNRATLAELRKRYGRDLRIVYRNMVVHPRQAMAGALASCAADKQRKWEAMENKLWEAFQQRQFDISEVDQGNGPQKCWDMADGCVNAVGHAKAIGLDVRRFKADMKGACLKLVNDDMSELQQTFALGATPSFFINGRYFSGAWPIEQFAALIDEELKKANAAIRKGTPRGRYYRTFVLGKGEKTVAQATGTMGAPPPPPRPEPDKTKNYAIKVDGYPSKGPADAKVTVVMFFDYATPYAERARKTLDELAQRYGKDIRFVYRTRLIHPRNAHAAALALCAAHKVGKTVAMDDALWEKAFGTRNFDNTEIDLGNGPQKCWDTAEGCKAVVQIAQDIGLDPRRFKADMKRCEKTIAEDDADAGTFRVNATPTFFINGRVLSGAQPVGSFTPIIDDELAKANDRIKKGTPKARYYKTWIVDRGEPNVP